MKDKIQKIQATLAKLDQVMATLLSIENDIGFSVPDLTQIVAAKILNLRAELSDLTDCLREE